MSAAGDPAPAAAALEARMQRSWSANAFAWTRAVREERIASRRAGTDEAIVAAVLAAGGARVLDLGCGEGWLARALALHACEVVGVDASPELIAAANELGGARFEVASYAELAARPPARPAFDAAVCNFSLLGEDLAPPLGAARRHLREGGRLFVQTVHPWSACGDLPYADGWRTETFDGFGGEFRAAMPWYFRTLGAWIAALRRAGFRVEQIAEPADPAGGGPLSLLLRAVADESPPSQNSARNP